MTGREQTGEPVEEAADHLARIKESKAVKLFKFFDRLKMAIKLEGIKF